MTRQPPNKPASARALRATGVLALACALWMNVSAPTGMAHADERDHELARRALREGKVLPLRTVLEQVERDYQGQVLEVELDRDDGMFIYEIKLLAPGGNLMKMKLDAATGKVLGIKQKGRH